MRAAAEENVQTGGLRAELLVVAGPTASGKSEAAVRLAKSFNGEVLAVDSVQIYRGCDVGSAKVSPAEQGGTRHHLLDVCSPAEPCNAARFCEMAEAAAAEIRARGKAVIACGGTTLYLKALLHGLADLPPGDIRLRQELDRLDNETLFQRLAEIDPETAKRLHPNDRLRVSRALEAHAVSGIRASSAFSEHAFRNPRCRSLILVLCWPRDLLYARINRRSSRMLEEGLIRETEALMQAFGPQIGVLKTIGYAQARAFLEGNLREEELPLQIAMETRRFAKRQMTFWRNEPVKRNWTIRPRPDEDGIYVGAESGSSRSAKGVRALKKSFSELEREIAQARPQGVEVWYLYAPALGE